MLDARNPAELLPLSLRASLGAAAWMNVAASDDEYGADYYVVGYQLPKVVDPSVSREAELFVRAVRLTCAPLCEEDLFMELGKLKMKVMRRAEDEADQQLLFEAYVEELRDYPADIVIEVLRLWPKMSRFWPALEELLEPIRRRVRQRESLLKALEELAERSDPEEVAAE